MTLRSCEMVFHNSYTFTFIYLYVHADDVQRSDWREVHQTQKEEWKSGTIIYGEQSAKTYLTTFVLPLSAIRSCWWHAFLLLIQHKTQGRTANQVGPVSAGPLSGKLAKLVPPDVRF